MLEFAFTGRCTGGFKRRSRKAERSSFFFFPGCPDSAVSQGNAKASQCVLQNRGGWVRDCPEQILGSKTTAQFCQFSDFGLKWAGALLGTR